MHSGLGRGLTAVYGIFALAATARAGYEFASKFDQAPLAYSLSLFSALVYIVATVCFVLGTRTSHRIAIGACLVEFVGVIVVGALSLIRPDLFPDSTVWSAFGIGYGFIPVILPLVGLWWLRRVGRAAQAASPAQV
ncbi:hypothetical protein GSY69_09585 [Brevibacterium sp. 5221]|uniref:Integral membrane protein n=2 Tax=Brevibacteriaceae TaxID=85019 RepID=A0A6N9H8R4_9MICO|nr:MULTISPECIES: hypothetical protein [Brevibacterium]MYM20211.1 hypothetical protein [Brevibacterium rongguiense]WAL41617.1 hypothetical protein BRM1_06185 [Brevibacterium sp. BRM-1]